MIKPFKLILDNNGKVGSDQNGGFGYVVIEDFLESIKEEDVQVELADVFYPKTQEPLDHISRDELIEHSICFDYIRSHNGNDANDEVECLEYIIIEAHLEAANGQFSLKDNEIVNTWKEESEPLSSKFQPDQLEEDLMEEELKEGMGYVTTGDQFLKSYGEGTMKMELISMNSKNMFSPWDSADNILQEFTHEQIHREVTFVSGHGEEWSLWMN